MSTAAKSSLKTPINRFLELSKDCSLLGSFLFTSPFYVPVTQRFWLCSVDFRRLAIQSTDIPRPMHLRLLPEKGKYKIHGGVKMKETVKRDFKVLSEKKSPENIAVMAELIAMRETKVLIGFMGYHAEKAHKKLCKDIFCKDKPGYVSSDSYDLVQNVALFLCDHCGEYLDDFLYLSAKGKQITIKMECYYLVMKYKCQCTDRDLDQLIHGWFLDL